MNGIKMDTWYELIYHCCDTAKYAAKYEMGGAGGIPGPLLMLFL